MLRKILEYSLVIIIISIITSIFTFPLFLNLKGSIYSDPEFHADPFSALWWIWYQRDYSKGIFSPKFIDITNYPFGIDYSGSIHQPLIDLLLRFGTLYFNEIVTYNLFIISGFIITGIISYLFFRYLIRDKLGALFGSIIFTFSIDHCMRSTQHMGFALLWWIPLFMLCVFRLRDKPGFMISVVTGIVFACTISANYYYGYFLLVFLFFMVVMKREFSFIKSLSIALGIPFLIALFMFKDLLLQKGFSSIIVAQPFKDLFKYAAHWWDYFLPSEFHPLFGRFTKKIVGTLGGRHYFERSLYLGYIPLLLGAVAVIKSRFGKKESAIPFFSICAVLFFILSLTPVFQVGNFKVPNFSFFMYRLLPMFRVYARMGILVMLSVSVLAGFGLKYALARMKSSYAKYGLTIFCIIGVLFEFMNFPPFHTINLTRVPEIYKWLAGGLDSVVVVEYPFVRSIEARHSEYLFWQRVHRKKLINGAPEGSLGDAFRRQMQYPQANEAVRLLAYLGADYMVVHKEFYSEEELAEIEVNLGLKFVKDFPEARVYRIIAEPDNLNIVYWQSFGSWEKWDDGNYWRWMGNNATIWVSVDKRKVVDIRFKILAFARDRELKIYVNDLLFNKLSVIPVDNPVKAQMVVLNGILLKEGENVIKFSTPQGEDRIGDVLHNNDDRRVSFAINDFIIKKSDG